LVAEIRHFSLCAEKKRCGAFGITIKTQNVARQGVGGRVTLGKPVRFGRFLLDPADERLIAPEGPVHIGNKAFRVLSELIAARGQLLTKDSLFESVWDGTIVSESALTSVIKELRRALGDESRAPSFIASAYGRGYRFIAELSDPGEADAPPAPAPVREAKTLELPDKPSIAVVRFTALGDDVEDWFADGIVEEIVVALTRFNTLFVIAASSSLTFSAPDRDHAAISRQLGVRYLLEGSVRRSGDRVRVTIRLIDGVAEQQIWADKFDDTMEDVFALHDRVALAVAGRIGSSIDDAETRRLNARPAEARDVTVLYARANAKLRAMRPDTLAEAIGYAEEILAINPANAWAASVAGFCHGLRANMGWSADPAADRASAIAYSDRATQLPGDDERVLGFCGAALACAGGDLAVATRLTDRGIEINPGSATVLFWGGWLDAIGGRAERGLERLEMSIRLNPLSEIRPLQLVPLGTCLLLLRRFDEAAVILGESVQNAPQGGGLAPLAVALAHAGKLDQAGDAYRRLAESGGSWAGLGLLQDPAHVALVHEGIAVAEAASVERLRA
jgi:TolB-like protein